MELPNALREALALATQNEDSTRLIKDAQTLSKLYRTKVGLGETLLTQDTQALAYAVARMPATYGATFSALRAALECANPFIESLLDVGAGTGAASWAAQSLLDVKSIVCLEREEAMQRIGTSLMHAGPPVLRQAVWKTCDIVTDEISESADLVVASYVLNEMTEEMRHSVIQKLWQSTQKLLLIIEPGTPAAFRQLQGVRRWLLNNHAHIAAPCPKNRECPMPSTDWCHFACRIPRSRLHRQLKGGEAPFEDEKFCYLACSKDIFPHTEARVLRHPLIHEGYLSLTLCTEDGIVERTLSKKDGELYKRARKLKPGDHFE